MTGQVELDWLSTAQLCKTLNVGRTTLWRMSRLSVLKSGRHYVPKNPWAKRSPLLWHRTRVALALGRQ